MPLEISEPPDRTLPVIVLADTSGSMAEDGKMKVLVHALGRLVEACLGLHIPGCAVHLAIITLGGSEASVALPLTPVAKVKSPTFTAAGKTHLGQGVQLAAEMLSDQEALPYRSYRPVLILVSDGIPTDDLSGPIRALNESEHGPRALRFSIALGADAKPDVLRSFCGEEGVTVLAHQASDIVDFFDFVSHGISENATNSVVSQTEIPSFDWFQAHDRAEF